MVASGCTSVNASPGLGFVHLSTSQAAVGSGGVRGVPKGYPSSSKEECCARCAANAHCTVWVQRSDGGGKASGKCFIGNCSASSELPCLERMRGGNSNAGAKSTSSPALLCTRPAAAASTDRRINSASSSEARSSTRAESLALLLLGHRSRLMLTTLMPNVVTPVVRAGTSVGLFALLENSSMAKAFRGRRPAGHPALAALTDAQLATRITRDLEAAGGHVGEISIRPRPLAAVPESHPLRLSRYTQHVKTTVVTRFLKEKLGMQATNRPRCMCTRHGAYYRH